MFVKVSLAVLTFVSGINAAAFLCVFACTCLWKRRRYSYARQND